MRLVPHYFSFTLWPDAAACGVIENAQLVRSVHIEVHLALPPGGARTNYVHGEMIDFALWDAEEESPVILSVHLQLPKSLAQLMDDRAAKGNEMLRALRSPGTIHPALASVRTTEQPTEDPWHDEFYFVYELRPESVQSPRSHIIAPASMHELLNVAEEVVTYLTERLRELYALDPNDELTLSRT